VLERLNTELVDAHRPGRGHLGELRELLARHAELTGSEAVAKLLTDWDQAAAGFWRVAPQAEVAAIEEAHQGTG
jgi:glutamate synthase domain-containing protein 3